MRILIIGGSLFLGKHLTKIGLEEGIEIVHFNRGRSNKNAFSKVETIVGDRISEIDKVGDQHWDAVIDTCGYFPEDVAESASFFLDKTHHYVYISSVSAYADFSKEGITEEAPVAGLLYAHERKITGENYGALKALCEQEVLLRFRDRAIIVRPGYITGPDDYTDRFTFWLHQFLQYDPVIVPPLKDSTVSFIDVRDLASWIYKLIMDERNGVFNAIDKEIPFEEMLGVMKDVIHSNSEIKEISLKDMQKHNIPFASYFPIWLDPNIKEFKGMNKISNDKALRTGLECRNHYETFYDMWQWFVSQNKDQLRAGFKAEDYNLLYKI